MLMGIISSGLLQMYQSDIALVHAQHIFCPWVLQDQRDDTNPVNLYLPDSSRWS